jgi:Predicted membrane protein
MGDKISDDAIYLNEGDEKRKKTYTYNLSMYKLFWTFIIFSIFGFIIESIWCIIRTDSLQSRQGLIYGPFSQIYGVGAILLIIATRKFNNRKDSDLFIYSAVMGAVFEFLCSLAQQNVFGCVSWQYDNLQFNLYGRISLMYSLIWGALGVIMVRYLYPLVDWFIERIPIKLGKILTVMLVILISFDIFISAAAVERENQRHHNIEAKSSFEVFLDKNYPDAYIKKIYPNMTFDK